MRGGEREWEKRKGEERRGEERRGERERRYEESGITERWGRAKCTDGRTGTIPHAV